MTMYTGPLDPLVSISFSNHGALQQVRRSGLMGAYPGLTYAQIEAIDCAIEDHMDKVERGLIGRKQSWTYGLEQEGSGFTLYVQMEKRNKELHLPHRLPKKKIVDF